MSSPTHISLSVTHRGKLYPLSLLPDSTLQALQAHLEELTSVPPSLQKLIYKGKKLTHDSAEVTLSQAGITDGIKVQMLGSTTQELGGLKTAEDEQKKKERILRERALKAPTKARASAFVARRLILCVSTGTIDCIGKHDVHKIPIPQPPASKLSAKLSFCALVP